MSEEREYYSREKLINYLVSLGVRRDDVEGVVKNYTNQVQKDSYEKGLRGLVRVNRAMRQFSRNLALEDLNEFIESIRGQYPEDHIEKIENLMYSHLPNIQ